MITGQFLVLAVFALCIAVFGAYLMSIGNGEKSGWKTAGRAGTWLMFILCGLALANLLVLFLNDRFFVKYVYENSSTTMPVLYKISAVWAGQDGTFLLWLFFLTLTSVLMLRSRVDNESRVMLFMKALELVMCVLLIQKSPFMLLGGGATPAEGSGMNPLLMNPWMAIHPPVVFLGFALTAAPFVIFLGSVSKGDATGWTRKARPWAIAALSILGAGIFLGCYWSYEVLGWGGYWAWDPVENASLFPWIALCALIHGMILQTYRRNYAFWNGVMVTIAYVMVIFSTFLTRSGILADFSLHSFSGLELYYPLLTALAGTALLGIVMLVRQLGLAVDLSGETRGNPMKPLLLTWSIYFFWIFFLFVFIGTTYPIFAKIMGAQPSPVQGGYYNNTSVVAGIPIALLLTVCPILFGRRSGKGLPWSMIALSVAGGCVAAYLTYITKTVHPAVVALAFVAASATVANTWCFFSHILARRMRFTSYLSHIGAAALIAGFVLSSVASRQDRIVLTRGETTSAFGYNVTLSGLSPTDTGALAEFTIEKNKKSFKENLDFVKDSMHRVKLNVPAIHHSASGDVYLSPVQIMLLDSQASDGSGESVMIERGNTYETKSGLEITFVKFDLARMQEMGVVGIVLAVKFEDSEQQIVIDYGPGAAEPEKQKVRLQIAPFEISVSSIEAASARVRLEVRNTNAETKPEKEKQKQDVAVMFQFSVKPYIGLVWMGMLLLTGGSLLAVWRRSPAGKTKN